MMWIVRKHGKTVKLCDEEGRRKQLAFPLTRATDRAAKYTGVSTTLVKRQADCQTIQTIMTNCHRCTDQGQRGLDLPIGMSPLTNLICQ